MRIAAAADTDLPWEALARRLRVGELDAASRLESDRRRRHFALGRIAARRAAAQLLGVVPSAVNVEARDGRAPRALANGRVVHLSISHSGGLAVAVASCMAAIGVDVERRRSSDIWESVFAFSDGERALFGPAGELAGRTSEEVGLFAWTAKESAWKAFHARETEGPAELEIVELNLGDSDRASGSALVETRASLRERAGAHRARVMLGTISRRDDSYMIAVVDGVVSLDGAVGNEVCA